MQNEHMKCYIYVLLSVFSFCLYLRLLTTDHLFSCLLNYTGHLTSLSLFLHEDDSYHLWRQIMNYKKKRWGAPLGQNFGAVSNLEDAVWGVLFLGSPSSTEVQPLFILPWYMPHSWSGALELVFFVVHWRWCHRGAGDFKPRLVLHDDHLHVRGGVTADSLTAKHRGGDGDAELHQHEQQKQSLNPLHHRWSVRK